VKQFQFAIPDISDPVIDRSTGYMNDQWYRFFEVFDFQAHDSAESVETLNTEKADKSIVLTAGVDLDGGGDLSAPRTFDHADTAVTPGTYGDATNVGAFTVNQRGHITAASNVPIALPFTDLTDVPASYTGHGGKVVKVRVDEAGLEFVAGGAGVTDFTDLGDVPSSYVGESLKLVRVNAGETGLEFVVGGGGATDFTDLGDVPSSYIGEALKHVRVNAGETALEFVDDEGITELTGDVTAGPGPGSKVATIANDAVTTVKIIDDAVTYAKIQNVSASDRVLGRKTAGAGNIEELTASELLDFLGTTHGAILYRDSAGWAILGPGTDGYALTTHGAAADPTWEPGGGGAADFTDLGDVPASYTGEGLKVVRVNAGETGLEFFTLSAGAVDFTDLGDVPASYTGEGYKGVRVNAGESALEFHEMSYDIGMAIGGVPRPSQIVAYAPCVSDFTLPASLTGSQAYCLVTPSSGTVVFDIEKDTSLIGTLTFTSGTEEGTFSFTTATGFINTTPVQNLNLRSPSDLKGMSDITVVFKARLD